MKSDLRFGKWRTKKLISLGVVAMWQNIGLLWYGSRWEWAGSTQWVVGPTHESSANGSHEPASNKRRIHRSLSLSTQWARWVDPKYSTTPHAISLYNVLDFRDNYLVSIFFSLTSLICFYCLRTIWSIVRDVFGFLDQNLGSKFFYYSISTVHSRPRHISGNRNSYQI